MSEASKRPLVEVGDLTVCFTLSDSVLSAVNGVSFSIEAGEVLVLLGESGSGKSVTLRALIGLNPAGRTRVGGRIRIGDDEITGMSERQLAELRGGKIGMIFQEPMTAFDPVYTVGEQVAETIVRHEGTSHAEARRRARELFELVQIPSAERRLNNYPFEMSGGMRQRAMIALALCCRPALLLADEPTTALDATVQIQILLLLRKLQQELGMAVIFVTHDVGVATEIADRVAVMYAGRLVETGPVRDVLRTPAHPYTRGLLASNVDGAMRGKPLQAIKGSPPDLTRLPPGCSFAPRCASLRPDCVAATPAEAAVSPGHLARCILVERAA